PPCVATPPPEDSKRLVRRRRRVRPRADHGWQPTPGCRENSRNIVVTRKASKCALWERCPPRSDHICQRPGRQRWREGRPFQPFLGAWFPTKVQYRRGRRWSQSRVSRGAFPCAGSEKRETASRRRPARRLAAPWEPDVAFGGDQ